MTWDIASGSGVNVLVPNTTIATVSINELDFIKRDHFAPEKSAGLDDASNASPNNDGESMLIWARHDSSNLILGIK
jgi:hypothetical protein